MMPLYQVITFRTWLTVIVLPRKPMGFRALLTACAQMMFASPPVADPMLVLDAQPANLMEIAKCAHHRIIVQMLQTAPVSPRSWTGWTVPLFAKALNASVAFAKAPVAMQQR